MNAEQRQANWRSWYNRNKKKMSRYYHQRYVNKRKSETLKQRLVRLKEAREYRKQYMKENREKVNAVRQEWRKKHPAKVRARRRRHYLKHRTAILKKGRVRSKQWRESQPERVKLLKRASWLKNQYGLTLADYDEMLRCTDGHCYLCPSTNKGRHGVFNIWINASGKVLGLICNSCRFKETWKQIQKGQ